jgi:methylmalonyl-CoA mutase
LHEQEASTAAFFTAEGIELKPILLKISITLILVPAFLPIWGPYTTMYVRRPGPFVNMLDFQQPKSNAFDVILLQDKRTIDRFRFADTPWV